MPVQKVAQILLKRTVNCIAPSSRGLLRIAFGTTTAATCRHLSVATALLRAVHASRYRDHISNEVSCRFRAASLLGKRVYEQVLSLVCSVKQAEMAPIAELQCTDEVLIDPLTGKSMTYKVVKPRQMVGSIQTREGCAFALPRACLRSRLMSAPNVVRRAQLCAAREHGRSSRVYHRR